MALNLGELVAGLRADETEFVRALDEAELALRGLTRDADNQLRDLNGRFVTESEAMGESLAYRIGSGARRAVMEIRKVGPAVAALGAGVPAVAAVTTAFAGLAAGAVSAGLAVKAFQLAAKPQLEEVTAATEAAEKAEEAHEQATLKKAQAQKLAAKGGAEYKAALQEAKSAAKAAKDADAEYQHSLEGMPPATREMAEALAGLKKDHEAWSEELSSTTMPVFTKGIGILRDLLPTLTPFVKAAADAFSEFLDGVGKGVKSAGFKEWAADMAKAAGPALLNFLKTIKNFAVGFGGLMQAFSSTSDNSTGGLLKMSEAFAKWGTSLKDSEGFAQFIALARQGATLIGQLAVAAGSLLVAFGPLIGVTTQVALALAKVVNSLPPEVLTVLATAIGTVVIGMKAYSAASRVVTVANALMRSSTFRAIAGWARMTAVGVAAYARTAAAATASAARTAAAWVRSAATSVASFARIAAAATANAARTAAAWAGAALRSMATFAAQIIRTAAVAVAQFAMMAARAVVWAATMAAQWLIAMGPVGWIIAAVVGLVALIIAYWDEIKAFTIAAWNAVWGFIKGAAQKIWDLFLSWMIVGLIIKHWDSIKSKTISAWNTILAWVKRIPGLIYNAFLKWTALGLLIKHWNSMKTATVNKATELINWVKSIPGRVKSALGNLGGVLLGAGKALIQGFINGIKNMLGSVKNAASRVVSAARDYFPFSPAKKGPFSGRGYTSYSGQALVGDFAKSIAGGAPGVRSALNGLSGMAATQLAGLPGMDVSMRGLIPPPVNSQSTTSGRGLNGGSGGLRTTRIELGGELGDALVGAIRKKVGIAGGDVQLYLGGRR